MKKLVKISLSLILIAIWAMSCKLQEFYEPEALIAKVPIIIDWSESTVDEQDINNVSVHIHPHDGSAPIVVYSSNPHFVSVSLCKGVYDIIVHNETSEDLKGSITRGGRV